MDNTCREELINKKQRLEELLELNNLTTCVCFNDTDSVGISLYQLSSAFNSDYGIEITNSNCVTENGYKIVEECSDYISYEYDKWLFEQTNTNNNQISFKREKICDVGIWLEKKNKDEEAKKNYIVHILDEEDVKMRKFKYTGVKLAKAVIPKKLKDSAKKIVEHMLLTQNRQETDKMVQEFYADFCEMTIDEKATIQRCNHMKKYYTGEIGNYILKTPGHIRAAQDYNGIIKDLGLNHLINIRSKDMVKIVYVDRNNRYGIEKIAFPAEWPVEFDNIFKIDERTMFEKAIYDEIKRIYKTAKWPAFNPAQNFTFNLYDMLFGD